MNSLVHAGEKRQIVFFKCTITSAIRAAHAKKENTTTQKKCRSCFALCAALHFLRNILCFHFENEINAHLMVCDDLLQARGFLQGTASNTTEQDQAQGQGRRHGKEKKPSKQKKKKKSPRRPPQEQRQQQEQQQQRKTRAYQIKQAEQNKQRKTYNRREGRGGRDKKRKKKTTRRRENRGAVSASRNEGQGFACPGGRWEW